MATVHGKASGTLGDLLHVQCRGCGLWYSFKLTAEDELWEAGDSYCSLDGHPLITESEDNEILEGRWY